jgi:hypothetical protein
MDLDTQRQKYKAGCQKCLNRSVKNTKAKGKTRTHNSKENSQKKKSLKFRE